MTILAHTLKDIIKLVPEAMEHVKQASLDKELPCDSRDSCIASALQINYFTNIDYHPVDYESITKIASAVEMFGVKTLVDTLSIEMVKASAEGMLSKEARSIKTLMADMAFFEGELTGLFPTTTLTKAASVAEALYDRTTQAGIAATDAVELYSGHKLLNKQAAETALMARFFHTKDTEFTKIATAIKNTPDADMTPEMLSKLASMVTQKDIDHNLTAKGHSFYKEAFFKKEADFKSSLMVTLAGKQIPYESLERVGPRNISSYIGTDVANEMRSGPAHFKQVVETLPSDLQGVLLDLVKNV